MINTKAFKLSDIFYISRGKRQKQKDRKKGNIDYYSASSFNNALTDKISNPRFIEKNALIFTVFGDCFFIDNDFTASDTISILKIKKDFKVNVNKFIWLYLVSVLNNLKTHFSFGRQAFSKKLQKETIFLPTKNSQPDWNLMEKYMKEKALNINIKKSAKNKKTFSYPLTKDSFTNFFIKDVFIIAGSGKSISKKNIFSGKFNYISTKATLNGLQLKSNIFECSGNIITVDSATFGICFYQESAFVASDHVETLKLKTTTLNKWVGLFLVCMLRKNMNLYSYGRKRSQKRLKKEQIWLPKNQQGNIDFKFMEKYMKERAKNIYF